MTRRGSERGLRALYAEDPERADWLVFGRRAGPGRRGFLKGAGLGAMSAGRQARLIELDPKYCDVIVRRWQEFSGGVAILDDDGRTYDGVTAEREAVAA